MDKVTEKLLDTVAQKAASDAVAKLREFHQDDLKVLGERMDIGFEKVERQLHETNLRIDQTNIRLDAAIISIDHTSTRIDHTSTRIDHTSTRIDETNTRIDAISTRIDGTNTRLDRIENALTTLLQEFKIYQDKQRQLETMVAELTERVIVLEKHLVHK
jgi:chromosome segregation ATPase